jgi:hypothetical protein
MIARQLKTYRSAEKDPEIDPSRPLEPLLRLMVGNQRETCKG